MNLYDYCDEDVSILGGHVIHLVVPIEAYRELTRLEVHNAPEVSRLERVVARDASASYKYAWWQRERWSPGEPAILTCPYTAFMYARDIIRRRWPEAEPIIKTHAGAAVGYSLNILKDRWPEAEATTLRGGNWYHWDAYVEGLANLGIYVEDIDDYA